MDPLLEVSHAHKKVYEMPTVYQKVLSVVNVLNLAEYVKTLNNFFTETILPHFDCEEREIFPILISEVADSQPIITLVMQEHEQLREKLRQLNELNSELQANPQATQKQKDVVAGLCNEITRGLTEHAELEDEKLYPLLKDTSFFLPPGAAKQFPQAIP
jgi:iron-sulfur cluster repair protein YtfE (RIC family)